jgi:hypothetical protein
MLLLAPHSWGNKVCKYPIAILCNQKQIRCPLFGFFSLVFLPLTQRTSRLHREKEYTAKPGWGPTLVFLGFFWMRLFIWVPSSTSSQVLDFWWNKTSVVGRCKDLRSVNKINQEQRWQRKNVKDLRSTKKQSQKKPFKIAASNLSLQKGWQS